MTSTSVRNLVLLVIGMSVGCILAYMVHSPFFLFFTIVVGLLPFIMAMLVGGAKTTTA